MHDFKKLALASLLAATPLAALAQVQSGSPAQSVEADPAEEVASGEVTGTSMEETSKAVDTKYQTQVVDDTEGSLVEDDAKADE